MRRSMDLFKTFPPQQVSEIKMMDEKAGENGNLSRSLSNLALLRMLQPWRHHRMLSQGLSVELPFLLRRESQGRLQGGQDCLLHQARPKVCDQAQCKKFPRGSDDLG